MNNARTAYPFYLLFVVAACFSFVWGHKGFAGFDLSPMISANNIALLHQSQDMAVSNPMPPGFVMVTYLFTYLFGGGYLSYFLGNILYCGLLYVIGIWSISGFKEDDVLYKLLNAQLLLIVSIGLVTDGHFYISDTSNVYCSFVFYLFEVFVLRLYRYGLDKRLLYMLVFLLGLCLFLRQNIGLMTFVLIYLSLIFFVVITRQSAGVIMLSVFGVIISVLFFAGVVHYLLGVEMPVYIKTVKALAKHRGSLDFSNLFVGVYSLPEEGYTRAVQLIRFVSYVLAFMMLVSVLMLRKGVVENGVVLMLIVVPNLIIESSYKYAVVLNYVVLLLLNIIYVFRVLKTRKASDKKIIFLLLLGGVYVLAGLVCMMTNYDMKSSEYPIVIAGIFAVLIGSYLAGVLRDDVLRYVMILSMILGLVFVYEGYGRIKLLAAGPPSQEDDFKSMVNDRFFASLHTSQYHKEMLISIDKLMAENPQYLSGGDVMFGPRLEYLYAKYKILPPKGLPLWWHFNTSYVEKDIDGIKQVVNSGRIKIMVFGGDKDPDYALMDDDLKKCIVKNENYVIDRSYKNILVFRYSKIN